MFIIFFHTFCYIICPHLSFHDTFIYIFIIELYIVVIFNKTLLVPYQLVVRFLLNLIQI